MHPNALLDTATELLREVGKLDMPADVIVSNFFRKHRELGPHEQQWLKGVNAIDRSAFSEKLRHNMPDWLAGALKNDLDDEGFWNFVASMSGSAPLDLRVNMLKTNRDKAQAQLHEAGIE